MPDDHSRNPAVSVVIPVYNAGRTLRASVCSVLNQTASDLEVIVVDDGSIDGTLEVARSIADSRVVVLEQPNAGPSSARNTGLAGARGSLVVFLDGDDLLLPGYVDAVQDTLARDPKVDFVYADAWTFDDRTRRVRRHTTAHYVRSKATLPGPGASAHETFAALLSSNFIIIPVAARTAVLRSVGGFDPAIHAAEDWDLWLRMTLAGHRAREAPGPLGLRREHRAQASTDLAHLIRGRIQVLEKLLANPDLYSEVAPRVRWQLDRDRAALNAETGADRWGARRLQARRRLGSVRRATGLGARWHRVPPEPVRAAFGDLRDI